MPRPSRAGEYPIRPPGAVLMAANAIPSNAATTTDQTTGTQNITDQAAGSAVDLPITVNEGVYYQFLVRAYAASTTATNGPASILILAVVTVVGGVATIDSQTTLSTFTPGGTPWVMSLIAVGNAISLHFDPSSDTSNTIDVDAWFEWIQIPGFEL